MTDHCAMADPFHRALCREELGHTRTRTRSNTPIERNFQWTQRTRKWLGGFEDVDVTRDEPLSEQIVNGQA